MNGAVAGVLNKVLGDWIENLDSENLNLSVFSGEILLQDLCIKPEAFNNLGLPFQLLKGYIGKLSAKIPWTSLGSSPLKILIENIHISLSPISADSWKEDFEVSRYFSKKIASLKQSEALSEAELDEKPAGFVEKLVGKIVDNLQIEIRSVCVYYSDGISSNSPFAFGLVIGGVKAVTCNSNWQEEFVEGSTVMYKLAQVSDLRMFLDYGGLEKELGKNEFLGEVEHNFIIPHTTLRLEAVINKKSNDFSMPQVRLDFSASHLQFILDTIQLQHLVKALNFFNYFAKFQKGVIQDIVEENFTAEEAEQYRNLYIQGKTPVKNKAKALQLAKDLENYEKAKNIEAVIHQRKLATKEFELLKIEAATKQEIESTSAAPSKMSRFTGFFSGASNVSEEEKLAKLEKLKQQLNKINEDRGKLSAEVENLISDAEVFTEFPVDFLRFRFVFTISDLSLKICEGKSDFLLYSLTGPSVGISLFPESFVLTAGIKSSLLLDLQDDLVFPQILKSESYSIIVRNKPSLFIEMTSGELEFVLKIKSLMRVGEALKKPLVKDLDYSQYTKAATDKTKEYISRGEEYLAEVMTTGIKASIGLDVHLKAPMILIPLDTNDPSQGILVIDLGSIDITTASKNLEENLYDQYTFHLGNLQSFTCGQYPYQGQSPRNQILIPVSLDLILYNSLTDNSAVPAFILELYLSKFEGFLQDTVVQFLLRLKDSLSDDTPPVKAPEIPAELYRQETIIKVLLILKFKVVIREVLISLISKNEKIVTAEISDFSVMALLKGANDLKSEFHLGFIEIRDCRPGVLMEKIVCNPLLQPFDDEFADAVEELKQVSGEFSFDGKAKAQILISDLRVALDHDICSVLLKFAEVFEIKPSDTEIIHPVLQKSFDVELELSAKLSNITILLPLDTRNLTKRVGLFRVSIAMDYFVKKKKTAEKYEVHNEALHLQFESITAVVGIFSNNTVKSTRQKKVNLLDPTKFNVSYSKSLQQSELTSAVTIEVSVIHIEIGFRDVDFANKLLSNWKQLGISSSPNKSAPAPSVPLKFLLNSHEIEAKISDDSISNPTPLLFFCFTQVQLNASIYPDETSLTLCTSLLANCFNTQKEKIVTEPLIEPWEFTIGFKKRSPDIDLDLKLCSAQFLNVNISASMLKTLGNVVKKFSQNPDFWMNEVCDESLNEYVWIVNELGEDLAINLPDENACILLKKEKIMVRNRSDSLGKFNSHIILQVDNSDQVYLEIEGNSKEFTIKRGENYIGCLLNLQENSEQTTYVLQTETEFFNATDKNLEVSSKSEKLEIRAGEKVKMPLGWFNQDLKVLTDTGPMMFANTFTLLSTFISIERLTVKDSSNFLRLVYIFIPTYFIQNLLPCSFTLFHQPIGSIRLGINSGETKAIGLNPKALGKIQLNLAMPIPMPTAWCELSSNLTKINVPENSNRITIETIEYDISTLLPNFTLISKNVNCKLIQVYARYILLNKSNLPLELKANLVVPSNSLSLLRVKRDKIKVRARISGKTTAWCKVVNTKTLGISGCISLDNSKNSGPQEVSLGVQILSGPLPLIKSKIICISPHYVIANSTNREIFTRQVINGKPGNIISKVSEEAKEFHLENSFESKLLQISTNTKHWSYGFNVDEITEFQICLDSLPNEIAEHGEWYLPNLTNDNKTFILVSVYSEDNCTINIHFRNPAFPEFLIANYTEGPITLRSEKYSYTIPPSVEFPWANSNKVTIRKDMNEVTYSLLKVKKKKKADWINAEVKIDGVTRRLEIGNKIIVVEEGEKKQIFLKSEVMITLQGFGVSLFSETSNEMFLFMVCGIYLRLRQKQGEDGGKRVKVDLNVQKLQLDNMDKEENQYGVMFSGQGDAEVPFFQCKIHQTSNSTYTKYPWVEVIFQEIQVQLNQEVIYRILDFISSTKEEFSDKPSFIPISSENLYEVFPDLVPVLPQEIEKNKSSSNIYVNYLHLYALKIVLSFKVPSKKLDLKLDPRHGFGIGTAAVSVASSFVNITDSALVFTEIVVTDIFQTPQKLQDVIIQNYKQQGIRQVYKVLGSSDMLGNPVRLMNKLGTGVFEFFSEPVKGLLKGPRGFNDGVKAGVKSLVSNILGGGMQTVSTISGNLYNVVNKVKGKEAQDLGQEKLGGSFIGGMKDIGKGVTGIFSKPWEGLKSGGGTGLIKGIGSGFVGAVTAPISATLRISSGISGEVSSAVSSKKAELVRMRDPKKLKK